MTETFIESAMLALSGAWNNDTVNVNCQPLTEALMTVSGSLAQLRQQVAALQDTVTHLRTTSEGLEEELLQQRSRTTDVEMRLSLLTTDTHGFIQRPELNDRLSQLRSEMLVSQRADVDKLGAVIDNHYTQQYETAALAQRSRDTFELYRRGADDAHQQLRSALAAHEEFTKSKLNEHAATLDTLSLRIREGAVAAQRTREEDMDALASQLKAVEATASSELARNTNDILAHLKEQDEAIGTLRRVHEARVAATPSQDEIETLIAGMDKSRAAIDEAQYRLTETFSQCMALIGSATTSNRIVVGDQHTHHGSANDSFGAMPSATPKAQRAGGTSVAASRVLASLRPSAGATALLGTVPVGLEVQLDSMRHDVRCLQEDVIPGCVKELQGLAKDVGAVGRVVERGEQLVASLVECLSLGDGDELRASLLAHDHHKTIVLLRRAFAVLASSKFTMGGATATTTAASPPDADKAAKQTKRKPATSSSATGPDAATRRDGATTSRDMDTDAPADASVGDTSGTAFVPPSVWDKRASVAAPAEDDPAIAEILRKYRAPHLGLDLADAVGGTLGANVMLVSRDGIAYTHGVNAGDRIIKINGERCDNCNTFVTLLQTATRRAVINHHAQGMPSSTPPTLVLDLTLIPSRSSATRHVNIRCRLQNGSQ
jgi:hypothetical protein